MLDDAGAIASALDGSVLGGRPVVEIPMVGADQMAFAVECEPDEVLGTWQAARAALPVTGRWPLAVMGWEGFGGPGWLARLAEDRVEALRQLAEMRYATGDHTLGRREWAVNVPPVESALSEALARIADEEVGEEEVDGDYPDWFEPAPGEAVLMLPPVANGWDTLTDFPFDGGSGGLGGGAGRLIAVVRSWHERFGAELVANWATMLQFVVERPPETYEDAWQLALEHQAVAPVGVPLRRHARVLIGRRTWFLDHRSRRD